MNYTLNGIRVTIRSYTSDHNPNISNPYFNYFDDTNILSRRNGTTEIRDIISSILHTIRNDNTIQNDNTIITLDIDDKLATKESTCSICQNTIKIDESITELSCGHNFHIDCITEWGKYKPSCPLCRVEIPYHRVFID